MKNSRNSSPSREAKKGGLEKINIYKGILKKIIVKFQQFSRKNFYQRFCQNYNL